jgi:hypothetical protein
LASLCAYAFFTFYGSQFTKKQKLSFTAIWSWIRSSAACNTLLNAVETTQSTDNLWSCNPNSSMLGRTKFWFTNTFWWRIKSFERICIICNFAILPINIRWRNRSSAWFDYVSPCETMVDWRNLTKQ